VHGFGVRICHRVEGKRFGKEVYGKSVLLIVKDNCHFSYHHYFFSAIIAFDRIRVIIDSFSCNDVFGATFITFYFYAS